MNDKIYSFAVTLFIIVSCVAGFDIYAPKVLTGVCYGGRADNPVIEMPRVTITNFDGVDDKELHDVFIMEVGTFKQRLALLIGEIKEVECPEQLKKEYKP